VSLSEFLVPPATPGYLEHFDFQEAPFQENPDARFIYRSESLARALDGVSEEIDRGTRLMVVTGEDGAGKSTFCLELRRTLQARSVASLILDARDRHPKQDSAANDERPRVVVIDNTQDLEAELLGKFLAAVQTKSSGRWQLVLVGQPILELMLQREHALDVRTIHRQHLAPLDDLEVRDYLQRRMWVAHGGSARFSQRDVLRPRFAGRAIDLIAQASRGNPRTVNLICDEALTRVANRSGGVVGLRVVKGVVSDLALQRTSTHSGQSLGIALGIAASVIVGVVAAGFAVTQLTREAPDPGVASERERDEIRAASVLQEAPSAGGSTEAVPSFPPNQPFDELRTTALQRASSLSARPDVRAMVNLQEEVRRWERATKSDQQQAIADLLIELEELTNQARVRQLALDRELFRQAQRQR
jgi:general secretion pathway protein A